MAELKEDYIPVKVEAYKVLVKANQVTRLYENLLKAMVEIIPESPEIPEIYIDQVIRTNDDNVTNDVILNNAYIQSTKQRSFLPLLKEELRTYIQVRRLSQGKDELKLEPQEPPKYELSDHEIDKIGQRRTQNRKSSQRRRERDRNYENKLKLTIDSLTVNNTKLTREKNRLLRAKTELEKKLKRYFGCVCDKKTKATVLPATSLPVSSTLKSKSSPESMRKDMPNSKLEKENRSNNNSDSSKIISSAGQTHDRKRTDLNFNCTTSQSVCTPSSSTADKNKVKQNKLQKVEYDKSQKVNLNNSNYSNNGNPKTIGKKEVIDIVDLEFIAGNNTVDGMIKNSNESKQWETDFDCDFEHIVLEETSAEDSDLDFNIPNTVFDIL